VGKKVVFHARRRPSSEYKKQGVFWRGTVVLGACMQRWEHAVSVLSFMVRVGVGTKRGKAEPDTARAPMRSKGALSPVAPTGSAAMGTRIEKVSVPPKIAALIGGRGGRQHSSLHSGSQEKKEGALRPFLRVWGEGVAGR